MTYLSGTRVALTELRRQDAPILFRWINDPDVMRFNAPYQPVHETGHEAWFKGVTEDPNRILFGIRVVQEDRLVGTVQLIDVHPVHRTAELTIRIGEDADRGRGFGGEAIQLATDFAFQHRNIQRVWLKAFGDNERALRAYAKAGFVREGVLRRSAFIGGLWTDEIVMAKLRAEP